MTNKQYLETLFEEKNLPAYSWEIEDKNGVMNYIDSEVVIEAILNCPPREQEGIANICRQLDFQFAAFEDFLKHLAKGLINTRADLTGSF